MKPDITPEQPERKSKWPLVYRDPLALVVIVIGVIFAYPISKFFDIPFIIPAAIISYVLMMSFVVYAYFKVVRKKK